jgi:hypothetical protein
MPLKERTFELIERSTVHGFPNIIRSKNVFILIMWSSFTLTFTCLGSYFVIDSILDYSKFTTVTRIEVITQQQSQFPTVAFCGYPDLITPLNETILRLSYENQLVKNLSKVIEQFQDPLHGKCFRFNSGKNMQNEKLDIFNVTSSGQQYGLKLEINLVPANGYDFGEILVSIYNQSLPPVDYTNGGFWLRPGSWNHFQITRNFYENLGEPYSNCLKLPNQFKMIKTIINHMIELNRTYTQQNCFFICSHMFALNESNCGCNFSLRMFAENCLIQYYERTENNTKICIRNYLNDFYKIKLLKCNKYCPLECNLMSFSINSFSEQFPISGNISETIKSDYTYFKHFNTYEEANKHVVAIRVYYNDLKYTLSRAKD